MEAWQVQRPRFGSYGSRDRLAIVLGRRDKSADQARPADLLGRDGAATQPKAHPPAPAPHQGADPPRRVLVAEDNPLNQRVAVRMLEMRGWRVDVAPNGREVVRMHEAGDYDLILMDCQMPELDGYEATAEIRSGEAANRHTAIIALTSCTVDGDRERCLAAGMDDYLAKPLRSNALAEVLATLADARAGTEPGECTGTPELTGEAPRPHVTEKAP